MEDGRRQRHRRWEPQARVLVCRGASAPALGGAPSRVSRGAAPGRRLAAEGDRPRAASACVAVSGRTGGRTARWAWSDISVDLQRRSGEDGAGLHTGRCRTEPGGAAPENGVEAWSHSRPAPRPRMRSASAAVARRCSLFLSLNFALGRGSADNVFKNERMRIQRVILLIECWVYISPVQAPQRRFTRKRLFDEQT
jgi:hypothetical protein